MRDDRRRHTRARIVARVAAVHGWDPNRCVAYGDHASDIPMLSAVGSAVVVGTDLAATAAREGWRTLTPSTSE